MNKQRRMMTEQTAWGGMSEHRNEGLPLSLIDSNHKYRAHGIFHGKELTVLKGSRIRMDTNPIYYESNVSAEVRELRVNPDVVAPDGTVLRDVTFHSSTDAASFVAGTHRSSPQYWKNSEGITLKTLLGK